MKIKVKPEGREGVWIPDKLSLKKWIEEKKLKYIHNFIPNGSMFFGADHDVKSVLKDIDAGERIAILTGESWARQMNHALAIIANNKLQVYDIGEVTEDDLDIES